MNKELIEQLITALDRVRNNFIYAVRGVPVRDMAETLAECDAAIFTARLAVLQDASDSQSDEGGHLGDTPIE